MTGMQQVPGGIAASNFNNLQALISIAGGKGIFLKVFSFLEKDSDRPSFLPERLSFRGFEGRKFQYIVSLLELALKFKQGVFIFDHVRLARPPFPLVAFRGLTTVIFAHGSESWRRLNPMNQWLFEHATLCITNSDFTLRKMRERIPRFNGVACPLGLSTEFPLNQQVPVQSNGRLELEAVDGKTRPLGERTLLLVGRMDSREGKKGHRPLIQILPRLLEHFPGVQLVFSGPGDNRENLRKLAQERKVASHVFLPGWVPVTTLQSLYHHCYAFVMPSLQEGFGLVYLEAMNYAKPCVGCFDQGAEDIIIHGETGFLVHNPNDSEELFKVVSDLLKDPAGSRQMGEMGFQRLHQFFTARRHQERVKEAISRLL